MLGIIQLKAETEGAKRYQSLLLIKIRPAMRWEYWRPHFSYIQAVSKRIRRDWGEE